MLFHISWNVVPDKMEQHSMSLGTGFHLTSNKTVDAKQAFNGTLIILHIIIYYHLRDSS